MTCLRPPSSKLGCKVRPGTAPELVSPRLECPLGHALARAGEPENAALEPDVQAKLDAIMAEGVVSDPDVLRAAMRGFRACTSCIYICISVSHGRVTWAPRPRVCSRFDTNPCGTAS